MKPSSTSVFPPLAQPVTRTPVPSYVNAEPWIGTRPCASMVRFRIGMSKGTEPKPDSQTISHRPPTCSSATRARIRLLLSLRSM